MSEADLLSVEAVARRMDVSRRTVEREIAAGRLVARRIRSCVRIAPSELERYLATCPSEKPVSVGKSVSASEIISVLNALCPVAQPVTTRGRSKLRSAGRKSTLRLVVPENT